MSIIRLSNVSIEELNREYRKLIQHPSFLNWREDYQAFLDWYSGKNSIKKTRIKELKNQGIDPLNCNVIAPLVNVLLGIEIQNEYRIKVNVTNMTDDARNFEDGINQYFCVLQNNEEFIKNIRLALKDCLIGGLGFVRVCYKNHEPQLDYIDPLHIVLDFNDDTYNFSRQNSVVIWEDLHENDIKLKYGAKQCSSLKFGRQEYARKYFSNDLEGDLISTFKDNRVYTFYKKEITPGWEGEDGEGNIVKTVNEELADKLNNVYDTTLTINTNTVICQGKIIARNAAEPIVVNGEIPIVTMVYNREAGEAPRGLVQQLTNLQEGFNIALSRLTAYVNTEKTYAYIENVADRELLVNNPDLLVRPNAVVVLTPQDKIETVRPLEAINYQTQLLTNYLDLMKKTSGVEDETKGIPTNAVSGVAQQQRDISSMRCNAFLYDNFKTFKKRIGKHILQQLQNSFDTDIVVRMLDDDEKQAVVLNHVVQREDGSYEILNDLSLQKWNISIEQAPADSTTRLQKRLDLLSLSQTPLAPYIMKSKEWLGLFVSNPAKVLKEIQETTAQEMQIAAQAQAPTQQKNGII